MDSVTRMDGWEDDWEDESAAEAARDDVLLGIGEAGADAVSQGDGPRTTRILEGAQTGEGALSLDL